MSQGEELKKLLPDDNEGGKWVPRDKIPTLGHELNRKLTICARVSADNNEIESFANTKTLYANQLI